jgi:hypothetical protein
MRGRRHKQADQPTLVACRDAGISQQSYYRWRKEYGGLEIDQAKRRHFSSRHLVPYGTQKSHFVRNSFALRTKFHAICLA